MGAQSNYRSEGLCYLYQILSLSGFCQRETSKEEQEPPISSFQRPHRIINVFFDVNQTGCPNYR